MSQSYVKYKVPEEFSKTVYETIGLVRIGGKIAKGTNEITKAIERGEAKLVVMAEDVKPEEILMHIPLLCEEKEIPYTYVPNKSDLGSATGLKVSAASIAIVDSGENEKELRELIDKIKELRKE